MKKRRKSRKKISKGKVFMTALFALGVAITVAASSSAATGFQAQAIQQKIDNLAEENEQLEFRATTLKSLQTITNSVSHYGDMVKVENLKHITGQKQAEENQSASITANP